MVCLSASCPQEVFPASCWQNAGRALQRVAGQIAPGVTAPSYSTLLMSPHFLGKAENSEGKGTPKLKVSPVRIPESPHATSSQQEQVLSVAQGVLVGTLDLWEPVPLPTPFHPPTAGTRAASQSPAWKAALALTVAGSTPRGLRESTHRSGNMAVVSRPPCLSMFKGDTFWRGCP